MSHPQHLSQLISRPSSGLCYGSICSHYKICHRPRHNNPRRPSSPVWRAASKISKAPIAHGTPCPTQKIYRVPPELTFPGRFLPADRGLRVAVPAGTPPLAADHPLPDGGLPPGYPSGYTANLLFCFFNEEYWLYAVESYAYNLYFLFIVAYVCRAYVLKGKPAKGG